MTKGLPYGIGPRVALFLRNTYAQDRAKLVARQFNVSVTTSQRWLDGHAPTTAHLEAMVALWGDALVRVVFAEAFAAQDRHATALLEARAKLLEVLRHPSDPLATARQTQQQGFHWRYIWAPAPVPRAEYSARRVLGVDGARAPEPLVEQLQVVHLLNRLIQSMPKPTLWGRFKQMISSS